MPKVIYEFQGKYRFLSNFWDAPLVYDNIFYPNAECAYQAQKCPSRALEFANLTAGQAKRLGKKVSIVPNWNEIKIQAMCDIVYQKFAQNPGLAEMLLATDDAILLEGNNWDDTFWGIVNGVGTNWLGRILMGVRNELKKRIGVISNE